MLMEHAASGLSALAALIAALVSVYNARKIREVHVSINSRMDKLLQITEHSARADGVLLGRQAEIDEASIKYKRA